MTERLLPGYHSDECGRPVLAGLTFEETQEFEALDAQLPFDGQHVWPTDGLPRLPMEERWRELWMQHQTALAKDGRVGVSSRPA
jgi:hypothetical protein